MSEAAGKTPYSRVTRPLLVAVSHAVRGVDGVLSMSGTFTDKMKNIPGFGKPVKGVKISEDDDVLNVDIYVDVVFRSRIPQVAWNIQKEVMSLLSESCDIPVKSIDVHVQGVEPEKTGDTE